MTYLNTDALPAYYVVEAVVQDPVMTDYTRFVISAPNTLIILSKIVADKRISSKEDEPGLWLEQAEFPLIALPWVVKTIEVKFWQLPSQGGLPNDVLHVDGGFAGEELKIKHIPKCSDDGEKGIKLQNLSRITVNGRGTSQSVLLPNKLLQQSGLLQMFKNLCSKNNLPYPDVK
ncbi:hypothetical protein ORJ04_20850 [Rheinheimera baltica]|uniref:Uncharacterized protein n=1 Tax=Rheinheimera baltica TaxID=67576 RepID=A0ABT9I4R6_9GAMM|nr:hypothetical protein [Rheinheimera baltica]MDP5138402.1 hypothetical protein [Rheinheimera baltica]MDP5148845.1 hypothetical protein [Rheinheimera baltica]